MTHIDTWHLDKGISKENMSAKFKKFHLDTRTPATAGREELGTEGQ